MQKTLWGEATETGRRERHSRSARVPTVDVFDLLLPHLYPPVNQLLNQTILFPPDRRPSPYQVDGIRFLADHESALLGDEMGLGKTMQAILAFRLLYQRHQATRAVVVCPRSLVGNWQREFEKWAPDLLSVPVRGPQDVRDQLWQVKAPVLITTYETLRGDIRRNSAVNNLFAEGKMHVAIVDEIQRIKNPSSQISQSIRRAGTKYRWGLSGTPLENKLDDIVAIFRYLNPALFRRTQPPYIPETVKAAIQPHFLRRRISDMENNLPEKIVTEVWLELTDEQRVAYDRVFGSSRMRLSRPDATRVHVLTEITRLKQICNRDQDTGSSCKLEYLVEQLEKVMENDQKALVFSQFPQVTLRALLPSLRAFDPQVYDGSLSDRQRLAIEEAFQLRPSPKVLLMSVKAGGQGLNLQRANHVFHFDHWWNPAVSRQAEGRAHRRGQWQTVFVHDIYTIGTIEERIYELLRDKQELFDQVVDDLSTEGVQNQISIEELFGLFDLAPPATACRQEQSDRSRRRQHPAGARPAGGKESVLKDKDWHSMTAHQFEVLVARLYNSMGYTAQVTPRSHDGGVDVIARRILGPGHEERVLIQCKHHPEGSVGEPIVRELIGALELDRQANRAVIATSGRFTSGAVALAGKHRVNLIDRPVLESLLRRYNCVTPSERVRSRQKLRGVSDLGKPSG